MNLSLDVGLCHSFLTGNAAFLLVSNHFKIYPHDQAKVWHLLRLSILGIVLNFPFLIKNLVLLQFASKQNFGATCSRLLSDKEGNFLYHSRYSECDLPFPILDFGSQL